MTASLLLFIVREVVGLEAREGGEGKIKGVALTCG